MKPLHSQRIKQGQRILLISEKQKEGVSGGRVDEWGRGGPAVRFVLLWPLGKAEEDGGKKQRDVGDSKEDRKITLKNDNGLMPPVEITHTLTAGGRRKLHKL